MLHCFHKHIQVSYLRCVAAPRTIGLKRVPAAVYAGLGNRFGNERLGGYFNVVRNGEMSRYSDCAPNTAAAPDAHAASNPGACGNSSMRSYVHVVGNLDEVVELHTILDDSIVNGPPVYRRIGANLYIVTYYYPAHLGHFDPTSILNRYAESIRADDGSRMQNAAGTDPATLVNRYVGIKPGFVAQRGAVTDAAIRAYYNTVGKMHIFTQYHIRPDAHSCSYHG